MINNLKDIKKIRNSIGLSQKELAKIAGVSQSLIAKIESQIIDPSFSNAKKIIEALEITNTKNTKIAKDIMQSPVNFANINYSIKNVIEIMKDKNISQMPVKDGYNIIGTVTEKGILNSLLNNKTTISEIMEEAPPFVSQETPIAALIGLLQHFPIIIVGKKGKTVGIITKSDVIGLKT